MIGLDNYKYILILGKEFIMKRKILSIFLSLAVALTMMPAMAGVSFAGEANTTVSVELVKAQTSGSKAIKLSWNEVPGATEYVVYGQKCGKSYKKLETTSGTSYKVKKIKGKKLRAHKAYKFYVVAYSGNKKLVTSESIHFITGKTQGKYANARSISINKTSLTLEPGKTATLKATTKIYKNKKHIKKSHGAATRYLSDTPAVATVNASGVVTAVAEGTATIYVQDIGGLYCKTTMTVESPAPAEYTVTFDMQGHGTQIEPLNNVVSGSKISAPTAPTAAGYTFDGWYKEATCTNAWDFNEDTVTADTTLYAKWSQNPTPPPAPTEYTVSFDLNGATGEAPTAQTIASGSKVDKPADPSFDNHTFAGWYKTKDATTGELSEPWNFDNDVVTENITLYARWTRRIVNIIETVDFPMYTTDIPTDAWMDSSKPNNRVYGYNNWLFNILYVKANSQSDPLLQQSYGGMTSDNAEKNGNSYTYSNDYMKYTVTFNMTNEDKLESIEVKALEGADENVLDAVGTYSAPTPVSVTGVTLDKTEVTIEVEDADVKLVATVLPENAIDKSVTWSSSDESVATVDEEGTVRAVAAGEATITVTTVDGGKTATCDVKVTAPAPILTPVDAPVAATGLIYNGQEQTGVAEATGYTVTNGKATDAGSYTATATLAEGYKWSDNTTVAKQIEWSIAKAALTATADDITVTVGDGAPAYTVTYTGWVNGESIDTVEPTTAAVLACEYTPTSAASDYDITFTTAPVFANYDVTTVNGKLTAESSCIAAGTMISMPGGEQKAVEELEIGNVVCTFDHETGEVSSAPVCFIWESKNVANAFTLTFEDDVKVTVIEEHGFYDQEEQKYVFINLQNAEEYIGDHFYNADTNSWLALKNCEALNESIDAYAIITSGDLNHMSNGMLSMCDGSVKVLANIFEYDNQMKFDADKKKADIGAYGLTSKEKIMEFEGFFESDYDDYNLQYLNVAIGKGLTTWEWIKAFSDYCVANGL